MTATVLGAWCGSKQDAQEAAGKGQRAGTQLWVEHVLPDIEGGRWGVGHGPAAVVPGGQAYPMHTSLQHLIPCSAARSAKKEPASYRRGTAMLPSTRVCRLWPRSPHIQPHRLLGGRPRESRSHRHGRGLGIARCPSCLPVCMPASLQFYSNLGN